MEESLKILLPFYSAWRDEGNSHEVAIELLKVNGYEVEGHEHMLTQYYEQEVGGEGVDEGSRLTPQGHVVDCEDLTDFDAKNLVRDLSESMGIGVEDAIQMLDDEGYTVEGSSFADYFIPADQEEDEEDEECLSYYSSPELEEKDGPTTGWVDVSITKQEPVPRRQDMDYRGISASQLNFLRLKAQVEDKVRSAMKGKDGGMGKVLEVLNSFGLPLNTGEPPKTVLDPNFGDYSEKIEGCVLQRATEDCGNLITYTVFPDGELRAHWVSIRM